MKTAPRMSDAWRRHPLLLPAAGILGWCCALPFVAMIDSLALTFGPQAIAGIYGTHFLALLVLVLPVTAVATLIWRLVDRIAGHAWLRNQAWVGWCASTLFFLLFLYALRSVVIAWGARHGVVIPMATWLVVTMPLSALLARYAHALLENLVAFSWFLALAGALCLPLAFIDVDRTPSAAPIAAPRTRPDILLITIDTLAARQMSLYGADQRTTPNIDRLGKKALVFDHAYAGANFTTAGINTLLTGRYPDDHRAIQLGGRALPHYRSTSLPALIHRAGYRSAYVSTNNNAAPWRTGYARYFDDGVGDATQWRPYFCEDELVRWLPYNCQLNHPFINLATGFFYRNGADNLEFDGSLVTNGVERLIDRAKRDPRPMFLWTHLTPPHDPYAAPADCLGRFYSGPESRPAANSQPIYGLRPREVPLRTTRVLEQRYRESLWCVDRTVARVVANFEARGRPFVLIISADHGESFTPWLTGHGGPYLNEDAIRIPLLVTLPTMTNGRRIDAIASQTDILPMVAAILQGADANGLVTLVEARRRSEPALAMEFIDNARLAPLTRGGIAALSKGAKYIRYLSPPGPFAGLKDQTLGDASSTSMEGRRLRAAIANRLALYGGRIDQARR